VTVSGLTAESDKSEVVNMDHEKMAEGRRLAAEKRRAEEAQREAEEEALRIEKEKEKQRLREEREKRELDPVVIRDFEQLKVQLKTFYDELSLLSKKAPDGKLNKFKLKFLNDTLKKINAILGATHRPFPDFEVFADDELPSNSDAVLILSHYLKCLTQFFTDHSDKVGMDRKWCVKGAVAVGSEEDDDEEFEDDDEEDED
jgi:hypothetical protein